MEYAAAALALVAAAAVVVYTAIKMKEKKQVADGLGTVSNIIPDIPYVPAPTAVLVVKTGDRVMYASLEKSGTVSDFVKKLSPMLLSVEMKDCGGFKKISDLPFEVDLSAGEITAKPGDIVLDGGRIAVFYSGQETGNFAKIGSIKSVPEKELPEILGDGGVTVEFSLEWSE